MSRDIRENVRIIVKDEEGHPLSGMQVFIAKQKLSGKTNEEGIIEGQNVPRPVSAAFITLKYSNIIPFEYKGKQCIISPTSDDFKRGVQVKVYEVHLKLPQYKLDVVVQNQNGQPIDKVASLSLKDKDNSNEILKIDSLPAKGTVDIKALYGKDYDIIVQIEQDKTFSKPPNPLMEEFRLNPPSDSEPFYIFPIKNTRGEIHAGLKKQEKTLYIEFQTGQLVSVLKCVYPDDVPIPNKVVKYKDNSIGITDENGEIKPNFFTMDFITAESKNGNLIINGYPLRSMGFSENKNGETVAELSLKIPRTTLTIVVKDANGRKIEGVKITASSIKNPAGDEVYQRSTTKKGKEAMFSKISRLPGDTVAFSFSKENQEEKLAVQIKPDGDINIVSDPKIAKVEKNKTPKRLVITFSISKENTRSRIE